LEDSEDKHAVLVERGKSTLSVNRKPDRTRAMFTSLTLTVVLNSAAGVLTILFANGTTIMETNPYSNALLQKFGPATLIVHALEVAIVYPLAEAVSRIIASKRPIFRVKRIYLFTFSLAISVLPAGAAIDLLSDFLVVAFTNDALVGSLKIVVLSLIIAVTFAARQVNRKWTL
jgi:uncharacterized membrane protein